MRIRSLATVIIAAAVRSWGPRGSLIVAAGAVVMVLVAVTFVLLTLRGVRVDGPRIVVTLGADRANLPGLAVAPATVQELARLFQEVGHDIDDIHGADPAVPRVFVSQLPPDLTAMKSPNKRKALFISTVLPLVLLTNEIVLDIRREIVRLHRRTARGRSMRNAERLWLDRMFERHRVKNGDIDELLRRVDTIPVGLALAQAAIESGWGTSRFARDGNALYGQWTTETDRGLIPRGRDKDATHAIKSFDHLADSVIAYHRNLNLHRAYAKFRRLREAMRKRSGRLDGRVLARTLGSYSERGFDYVADLKWIISLNRLTRFRDARLMKRACLPAREGGEKRAPGHGLPTC